MVDRFAWSVGQLIPGDDLDDETDVQEGRHSAPWREDLHPRRADGKFGHGGGGGGAGFSDDVPRGRRRREDDAPNGAASSAPSRSRGMPNILATGRVALTKGGQATLAHHDNGDLSIGDGTQSKRLSGEQGKQVLTRASLADDWDVGDDETLPGIGRITRERGGVRVDLDDGPSLTLTHRDVTRMEREAEQGDKASRVDTGNGPLDVFAAGKKIGFRHVGDDGAPVEALFQRSSLQKISRLIDNWIDDIDDPDTPARSSYSRVVSTNLGKVQVNLHGDWTGGGAGDRLEILPLEGDWGLVVDGPRQREWSTAVSQLLDESAAIATDHDSAQLSERVTLTEAAGGQAVKGRRFRARLIAGDVQGSSGYYPASMLHQHASVFREGLPVYLDHPGVTETYERPERSVRDLAGRLATPATYQGDGLYADVEVYPHWAPVIEAMADDIGMSIRATGTVEASTQHGIRGPIVTSLTEATSVDFVTTPGAGGRIVALLESARAANLAPPFKKKGEGEDPEDLEDEDDDTGDDEDSKKKEKKGELPAFLKAKFAAKEADALAEAGSVAAGFESLLHSSFTQLANGMYGEGRLTRDERKSLSSAIGEALDAFTSRIEADHPHLYQRDLWADPAKDTPLMTDDTTITKGAPMTEGTSKETPPERGTVTEAAHDTDLAAALAEARRAATALTEAQTDAAQRIKALEEKLAQGDAEKLALTNDRTARAAVAEALRTSGLHALSHSRVTESVCRTLPTGEDGRLDTVKFGEAITAAITNERTYVASLAEASGAGMPRGLGESLSPSEPLTESAFETELTAQFERIGMTPAAAKIAAAGRR